MLRAAPKFPKFYLDLGLLLRRMGLSRQRPKQVLRDEQVIKAYLGTEDDVAPLDASEEE